MLYPNNSYAYSYWVHDRLRMTFTRQIQWIYMIVCRILLLQALQFYMLYTVTSLLLPAFTYYEDILEPTHSLDYLCYLHAFPGCPTYLLHLRFCHFLELLPFHGGNGFTCLTLTWHGNVLCCQESCNSAPLLGSRRTGSTELWQLFLEKMVIMLSPLPRKRLHCSLSQFLWQTERYRFRRRAQGPSETVQTNTYSCSPGC